MCIGTGVAQVLGFYKLEVIPMCSGAATRLCLPAPSPCTLGRLPSPTPGPAHSCVRLSHSAYYAKHSKRPLNFYLCPLSAWWLLKYF